LIEVKKKTASVLNFATDVFTFGFDQIKSSFLISIHLIQKQNHQKLLNM